jgi:DNA-binding CsgD family transcriptional regulator
VTPPVTVLADPTGLPLAARELTATGWRVHRGFAVPDEPWDLAPARLVLSGAIATEDDARVALVGVVRGAGLLVHVDRSASWAGTFLADLARLTAPVAAEPAPEQRGAPDGILSPEQRQILDLLAGGASIAQAARQLFWSLRTANRRVAAARDALGVSTTQEAVVAYARLRGTEPFLGQ